MKNSYYIGLSLLMIMSLVGCSNIDDKLTSNDTNQTEKPQVGDTETPQLMTQYLGKVETVIGNEISLQLAEDTMFPEGEFEGGEGDVGNFEFNGSSDMVISGIVSGEASVSAGEASVNEPDTTGDFIITEISPGGDIVASTDGEDLMESWFSDLEFTGESKELIIPAGAEIYDMKTGEMVKMTDVKEGSIISVLLDENTNAIVSLTIMG